MTTDLHIRVDATDALGLMGRISDNFPRARTNALNKVAVEVNGALRYDAERRFIWRDARAKRVLNDYAPIPLFRGQMARDDKPYATPVAPENAGKILRPFETGTPKTTSRFGAVPAIPTKMLRASGREVIPKAMFPSALFPELGTNYTIGKDASKWNKGKGRSGRAFKRVKPFIMRPGVNPKTWGIYKRFGPGRNDIAMLWAFRPSVRRPILLQTYATAQRVVAQRWAPVMAASFRAIVQSGKGKASLLDLGV